MLGGGRPAISRVLPMFLVAVVSGGCGSDATAPGGPQGEGALDPSPQEVPSEAAAWLKSTVSPFGGTHLSLPHDDLDVLRDLVGDARIVALGENTHGTRDFFEMKARILRFLVEEMGFDAFLIEATWPESNRLDRYVRTGEGDVGQYLTGLYFWTWRTEAVLEMIQWMRSHNAAGGSVGFYGFDMQYPGMAVANVVRYVADVDPAMLPETEARLACLARYANDHRGAFPSAPYAEAGAPFQTECLASLRAEEARLVADRDVYVVRSNARAFALALQSLRVAIQYHLVEVDDRSRDEFMAENTAWWARQLGPHSRVVLWAHNFHVSTRPGAQGAWLRQIFGDDMVVFGFSHEEGAFTAVTQHGSQYANLEQHNLDPVLPGSYESFFATTDAPRFFLDLRNRNLSTAASSWLSGPLRFRSIGCCYDPGLTENYWTTTTLPTVFDVVIHIRRTRATTLLPARYPTRF